MSRKMGEISRSIYYAAQLFSENFFKLYRAEAGQPEAYPNLHAVLTRPIDWQLIRQQYDQKIKYATATFWHGGDAWSPKRRTAWCGNGRAANFLGNQ